MATTDRTSGWTARPGRWSIAVALLVVFVLGLSGCERKGKSPVGPQPQARPKIGILPEGAPMPNIVFVLVDALRADRLGVYNRRSTLTPTMDAIAVSGVTFDRCVAPAPWTLPAVASVFVAYYPGVHKATSYGTIASMERGQRPYQSVLSDEFDTLAEVLQANGYETAGFCANKFIRARYGFAQGFDHFDTSFAENTVPGSKVNEAAFKWLEQRTSNQPFFLYLHYMDVHGPYNAAPKFMDPLMERVEANPKKRLLSSKEFRTLKPYLNQPPPESSDPTRFERLKGYREYWEARYDAGVTEAEYHIKALVRRLNELGLWDDAYVILFADHGEALCEHGLWGHGYSQHQTDLHVPLILRWPNVLPPGKRVRRLASLIDVMPTLLEQLRLPPGASLQGVSLVDHISGRLPREPLARFAEAIKAGPYQYAVFAETAKLITTHVPARKLPDGTTSKTTVRQQLFNVATDPQERYDLSAERPGEVKLLTKLLEKIIQTNRNTRPGLVVSKKAVDRETVQRLEALGYVGSADEEDTDEPESASQPAGGAAGESGDRNP